MSRRAINWQQAQARRYGAAIPQVRARVQRVSIRPVQLGPASSPWLPGVRERYELHESLASAIHDGLKARVDASTNAQARGAMVHPGLSLEQTREQFAALMEYVRLAELVSDAFERSTHASHIRMLLTENVRLLRSLDQRAMTDSSLPTTRDLRAVIVDRETAELALGPIDRIEAVRDGFGQRPWIWESRFWDGDYNREQQRLRDRDMALGSTGIRIPQPVLVTGQDIARLAAFLGCAA